ncbi:MAG: magnesium transporter [Caldilineaceae bacterium]|nr:magnesium transporter [Caldilineaceae bacterium]
MNETMTIEALMEKIQGLLRSEQGEAAAQMLRDLHPADSAEILYLLDGEDRALMLQLMEWEEVASVLEEMDQEEMVEIVRDLSVAELADVLDEMEPDMAADLLGELSEAEAAALLFEMEESDEVVPLLAYAEDTAGGIMTSARHMLRRHMTVQQAMDFLREYYEDETELYYLYVLDRYQRLVGVVSLRSLVLAEPEQTLGEIMQKDVMSVSADTDQEEVARLLARYNLLALPVLDDNGRMLGFVTVDDVVDVLEEEATEDIQRLGGSEPLSQPYFSVPLLTVARKRMGWLLLLFVGGTLTSSVMRIFETELEQILSLAVFIPLLIGTGGNAGSQSVSTIIRALAIGEVQFRDALRVILRELSTGLLVGSLLGIVGFGLALVWGAGVSMGIVIALSLPVVCTWANIVGGLVPLLAERLGIDAAVVSAPFITTVVDATGLALYFLIARLVLGL